jgi:hypothetical protein
LRIISQSYKARTLSVIFEGLAGTSYEIGLVHAERVASVAGGTLQNGLIKVVMPEGPAGEYVRAELRLRVR